MRFPTNGSLNPTMPAPFLSVIVPAYNEAARIIATLETLAQYLDGQAYDWEVIIVDDGSDDGTAELVGRWSSGRDGFCLESIRHGGKGAAVRHGMLAAKGRYRFMCDADLAMPIAHLSDFLAQMSEGYDIVIGSRQIAGANRYGESSSRHLMGRAFNTTVHLLAVRGLQDTQCGFKCFSAAAARELFPLQRTTGWGFDVELLYLASKRGMRILEMPIEWHHDADSRLSPFSAGLAMLRDVLAVRWRGLRGKYSLSNSAGEAPRSSDTAAPMARADSVAIVVPTYNEADNLPVLVERIFSLDIPNARIIVVDDNSPDGTADVACRLGEGYGCRLELIKRDAKNGLGTAYKVGFSRAIEQGADYVLQMDADLSHAPEYIPEFLDALGQADVVVGSRYTDGGDVDKGWHLRRHMLSAFANYGIRAVVGLKVKDSTTGFKAFRADALGSIAFEEFRCKGFGFQAEVAYACQRLGHRVVEYPITFYDRAYGESKLSVGIIWEALWRLFLLRWRKNRA